MRRILQLALFALVVLGLAHWANRDAHSPAAPAVLDIRAFSTVGFADEPCLVNGIQVQPGVIVGSGLFPALAGMLAGEGSLAALAISPTGQASPLSFHKTTTQAGDFAQSCAAQPPGTTLVLLSCGGFAESPTGNPELAKILANLGAHQAPDSNLAVSWVLITTKQPDQTWQAAGEVQGVGRCVDLACTLTLR